jgi:hypothetical protein
LFISIDQLCDADSAVLFLTHTVSIGNKNTVIMYDVWARATGLWHLDLSNPSPLHGSPPFTMTLLPPSTSCKQEVTRSSPHLNKPTATSAVLQLHTCHAAIGSAIPQTLVAFSHAALSSSALSMLVTAFLFVISHDGSTTPVSNGYS